MDVAVASATLGVGSHATYAELKHAYRRRLRDVHPDSARVADPDAIRMIKQAFRELSANASTVAAPQAASGFTYGRPSAPPPQYVDCYA